jgi:DNA replication protein DnaC
MITEETIQKLNEMKLHTMAKVLREILETAPGNALSFEEKVGMLVDREWSDRDNRRLARRLKEAKLGAGRASLEDVLVDPARGIEKSTLRELATPCRWARAKQNVVIIGATGVGKSFVGAALAQAACRHGMRALFVRVPRLVEEMAVARVAGTYASSLARIARVDVLVLDDLLLTPLKDTERRDLLEVIEDRYDRCSTVITSQLPTKTWHEALGDPTIADAICDRLVHNAHLLSLRGPSMRRKKGLTPTPETTPCGRSRVGFPRATSPQAGQVNLDFDVSPPDTFFPSGASDRNGKNHWSGMMENASANGPPTIT